MCAKSKTHFPFFVYIFYCCCCTSVHLRFSILVALIQNWPSQSIVSSSIFLVLKFSLNIRLVVHHTFWKRHQYIVWHVTDTLMVIQKVLNTRRIGERSDGHCRCHFYNKSIICNIVSYQVISTFKIISLKGSARDNFMWLSCDKKVSLIFSQSSIFL